MQDTRHNLHYRYSVGDDVLVRPAEYLQDVTYELDYGVPAFSSTVGNSLPTADELRRLERPRPHRNMPWTKWTVSVVVGVACLLGILLGVNRGGGSPDSKSLSGADGGIPGRSEKDVIEYLLQNKISNEESLNDVDSPQYQALQWMVKEDTNPWNIPSDHVNPREGYAFATRYVLAVLYFALGGPEWTYKFNFLSDADVCDWNGVILDIHSGQFSPKVGVRCDLLSVLPTKLVMTNNLLKGRLPTEIGLLFTLREMEMEQNFIEGSIPSELCKLDQLHRVMLGKNLLTGSIPNCISDLDGLSDLALNDNYLVGPLPSSLADSNLLSVLFLDDNRLTGDPLPILNQMVNLEFFMGQNNRFMGVLDNKSFKDSVKLAWLDLSGNMFLSPDSMAFPADLLRLPLLEVIDLSANDLSGPLPPDFPVNDRLKFLGLRDNVITGSIPTTIANIGALHHLDISQNMLTGTLDLLGELLSLRALYMGDNPRLAAAPIPGTFQNLFFLQDLSLRQSNRIEAIPEFLADLRSLKLIDLGSNGLAGYIPSPLGELTNLEFLMLNRNRRLVGDIPPSFDQLKKMRAIFFDGTNIVGNVEEVICELPNFVDLDGKQIAFADCFNGVFTCKCCLCCEPNSADCSSEPFQMNLRESWTKDFAKLNFEYTNETSFLERGEINAAAYHKQDNDGD